MAAQTIIIFLALTDRHTLTTRYSTHQLGSQCSHSGGECGDSSPTFAVTPRLQSKVYVYARIHTWQVINYLLPRATLTRTRFEPKSDIRRYTSTHNLMAFSNIPRQRGWNAAYNDPHEERRRNIISLGWIGPSMGGSGQGCLIISTDKGHLPNLTDLRTRIHHLGRFPRIWSSSALPMHILTHN